MKNTTLFILGCMLCFGGAKAQDWDSVGSGINGLARACAVYNGELYVGGYNITRAGASTVSNIARWNGTSWSGVGTGISVYGGIGAMQVYNGNLYVGGGFDTAGGVPVNNVAVWNGSIWAKAGTGISGGQAYIEAFAIYKGNLIAGGAFDSADGIAVNNIAVWNGSVWSALGLGFPGGAVASLLSYDSVLYAGGSFTNAGGHPASNIAQWNGSTWSAVGTGISAFDGGVLSMVTFNRQLYAGGEFDTAGGMVASNIARWNGSKWDSVGSGAGLYYYSYTNSVQSLTVAGGILYAAGWFHTAGKVAVNNVASWNGSKWSSVGAGMNDTAVFALELYNSHLYAAGLFLVSGTTPVNNIARWGMPLGVPDIKTSNDVAIYPNPNKGNFTISLSNTGLVSASQPIIEIYNIMGQKVFVETLKQVQGGNTINLSGNPSGVYLYRVVTQEGNLVGEGKVLIER